MMSEKECGDEFTLQQRLLHLRRTAHTCRVFFSIHFAIGISSNSQRISQQCLPTLFRVGKGP